MNNQDPKYIYPLTYGISLYNIQTKVSTNVGSRLEKTNVLDIGYMSVQEHPYDCGCLIIGNLNLCDKESLSYVEKFASLSGYSKIIGTVRAANIDCVYIKTLQAENYTFIDTGPSNRHPKYNTWLIYKVIKPKIEGYV